MMLEDDKNNSGCSTGLQSAYVDSSYSIHKQIVRAESRLDSLWREVFNSDPSTGSVGGRGPKGIPSNYTLREIQQESINDLMSTISRLEKVVKELLKEKNND